MIEYKNELPEPIYRNEDLVEYKVRGGKREGAGRPSLGTTKKVSITLPDDVWDRIDQERGEESLASFFRKLVIPEEDR